MCFFYLGSVFYLGRDLSLRVGRGGRADLVVWLKRPGANQHGRGVRGGGGVCERITGGMAVCATEAGRGGGFEGES